MGVFRTLFWGVLCAVPVGAVADNTVQIAYDVYAKSHTVGQLILSINSAKSPTQYHAVMENRGIVALFKPRMWYYQYNAQQGEYYQISVQKNRHKIYYFAHNSALKNTLKNKGLKNKGENPKWHTLKYSNGRGATLPPLQPHQQTGYPFLPAMVAVMKNGCNQKNMHIFTGFYQGAVVWKTPQSHPIKPPLNSASNFVCAWSLSDIFGTVDTPIQNAQTQFAILPNVAYPVPLSHCSPTPDCTVRMTMTGYTVGKQTVGTIPKLGKNGDYPQFWNRIQTLLKTPL